MSIAYYATTMALVGLLANTTRVLCTHNEIALAQVYISTIRIVRKHTSNLFHLHYDAILSFFFQVCANTQFIHLFLVRLMYERAVLVRPIHSVNTVFDLKLMKKI